MHRRLIPASRQFCCIALGAFLALTWGCREGEAPSPPAPASELLLPELPEALVSGDFEHPRAPERYRVRVAVADLGHFVVEVQRPWAPRAADRFHDLVQRGYFNDAPFFRVVKDFAVQFGRSAWPEATNAWLSRPLPDETEAKPQPNRIGTLAFAQRETPNTRTTEIFINLRDNSTPPSPGAPSLDEQGFLPFGRVVEGMDIVKAIYGEYGEMAPLRNDGGGVDPGRLAREGLRYIFEAFPMMDRIERATIEN